MKSKTQFEALQITAPILRALQDEGYTKPTAIQAQAIPLILQGKDLLGSAQTGTGKTAAFAIPILQLLNTSRPNGKRKKIRSLIVTPTRELAIQIGESFKAYGRYTDINCTLVFGGVNQKPQVASLRRGTDIVVATPGRLLDLMNQGHLNISDVEYFVLDEADRMLDMGFIHDIKKMLAKLPKEKQSLFFSATLPREIVRFSRTILNNPSKVSITPDEPVVDSIQQHVYFVDKKNKKALLVEVLKNEKIKNALVFTRTKHGADKIVKMLIRNNIKADAIHGNKAQNARQRALARFKKQATRVLVATDIAARGIDVDDLEYVINYEMSDVAETHVHRIGRTGRAGSEGTALSFCDAGEKKYLRNVEKLISQSIPVIKDHPFPLTDHSAKSPGKRKRNSRYSGQKSGGKNRNRRSRTSKSSR